MARNTCLSLAAATACALVAWACSSPSGSESSTAAPAAETKKPEVGQPAPAAKEATAPSVAAIGELAPDFTLTDLEGRTFVLSELRGKTVVLEWINPGCPYVVHAHEQGPLAEMGNRLQDQGVVWLAINSGAPGKQGAGADVNRQAKEEWAMRYPVLLDASGTVGRAYQAKTTPHMYVIDKNGVLAYRGALDNAPMGRAEGAEFVNYGEKALAELASGKVSVPETKSYGCSVKYAN